MKAVSKEPDSVMGWPVKSYGVWGFILGRWKIAPWAIAALFAVAAGVLIETVFSAGSGLLAGGLLVVLPFLRATAKIIDPASKALEVSIPGIEKSVSLESLDAVLGSGCHVWLVRDGFPLCLTFDSPQTAEEIRRALAVPAKTYAIRVSGSVRLEFGADGVLLRKRWCRPRFTAYQDIAGLVPGPTSLVLRLRDESVVSLSMTSGSVATLVHSLVTEGMEMARFAKEAAPEIALPKRLPNEPLADWTARVRETLQGGGYRAKAVPRARLRLQTRNPASDADGQLGAALALSDGGKERQALADAMAVTANPTVRAVLGAVLRMPSPTANDEPVEQPGEELELAVEDPEEARAARTRSL